MILSDNPLPPIRDPDEGFRYRFAYNEAYALLEMYWYRSNPTTAQMDAKRAGLWDELIERYPGWTHDALLRGAVEDVCLGYRPRW